MTDILERLRLREMDGVATLGELAAIDEIERLKRLITWCAPRLKKDEYAITLWKQLDNPSERDDTPIVSSNALKDRKDK